MIEQEFCRQKFDMENSDGNRYQHAHIARLQVDPGIG